MYVSVFSFYQFQSRDLWESVGCAVYPTNLAAMACCFVPESGYVLKPQFLPESPSCLALFNGKK
jgi:hypothetical protein